MSELYHYVNNLFRKYGNSKKINELKIEILSNLEAKKADLIAAGLDEETANNKVKESIKSIDELIDGNKNVYLNQCKLAILQHALLYLVITWVITIPLIVIGFLPINLLLLSAIIIVGIIYLFMRNSRNINKQRYINIDSIIKQKRVVWIVWSIFFGLCILLDIGVNFGSNIWFARPVQIDGPYSFAIIISRFVQPTITIIIPLIVGSLPKLILKYEVGESYEE